MYILTDIKGLDSKIEPYVAALREANIETFESCQGGEGHPYPVPTIRFNGDVSEGWRALAVALQRQLPVAELKRVWSMQDLCPEGPVWEMTFTFPSG